MGWFRVVAAGAMALVLTSCGGGSGGHSGSGPSAGSPTTSTQSRPPAARVPAAFAGHLLQNDELSGSLSTDAAVYRTPGGFVSSEQLSPDQAAAETRMLEQSGFRVAVREDLDKAGLAAISVVERFGSPPAARSALRFYISQFRRTGKASHYTAFHVSGLPGAVGFELGDPGGAGINIAFNAGDYYYLVGQVGSGPASEAGLAAAARSLYSRVRG